MSQKILFFFSSLASEKDVATQNVIISPCYKSGVEGKVSMRWLLGVRILDSNQNYETEEAINIARI